MTPDLSIEITPAEGLLEKVRSFRQNGYRLVQIGAVRLPGQIELTYSFDLQGQLKNLRLVLPASAPVLPSISSIYACAVLYENEVHDLFQVQVEGLTLDFHGHLYETAVKFPFGTVKPPVAKAVPAPAKPAAAPVPARAPGAASQ